MSWNTMAAAAAAGRCMTPSPSRAIVQSRRAASALSRCVWSWWRAKTNAITSSTPPIENRMTRLVTAQCGISAAESTQTTSSAAGMTSNARCANTVPTSVAQAPRSRGMCRVSTATRASSPTRPGIVAFASSPTENAEKTCMKPRVRRRHRLVDHRRPGEGPRDHRDEVEADRGRRATPTRPRGTRRRRRSSRARRSRRRRQRPPARRRRHRPAPSGSAAAPARAASRRYRRPPGALGDEP